MTTRREGPQVPFCEQVHAEKYRAPGEPFREAMNRIAAGLADDDRHYRAFRDALLDMRFLPAGRVQAAIGSARHVTAINCFVSGTIPDSFVERVEPDHSSIMHRAEQAARTMRMGGGIGYDFSTLRPEGALVRSLQSGASGPLGFMPIFDAVGHATSSAGNRRGAQMGILRIDHPDVMRFIRAKQNEDRLTGFNVSVAVTDEFMEALARGGTYRLRWADRDWGELDAGEVWEALMRSTWDWGEPGVFFVDAANAWNNLWYCEKIVATNPCVGGSTPVLTDRGWVPIADLVGGTVNVWNGEEWSPVEPRPTGRDQPMVEVELSNGERLRCTRAHRWVLADGSRVEADDLLPGDELLETEWPVVDGGEDAPGAYTQGVFSGDGWVDARGRAYVSFKREDKMHGVGPHLDCVRTYDTATGYRFYALDSSKYHDKTFVPGCEWSVQSRLDWLAGLLDSDGGVAWSRGAGGERTSCSAIVSSIDRGFVDRVALLLRTLGVSSNRDVDDRSERGTAAFPNSRPCWRIAVKSSMLRRLQDMGLQLRRQSLEENRPRSANRVRLTVVAVRSAGVEGVVYCFTEPKAHRGCFAGILTGQCGEQPLPPHGACLLGSFNLPRYVTASRSFDEDAFAADIPPAVRAMDNVVDASHYPLEEQGREERAKRRMGLGVTGLANAVEAMGMPYGSPEALAWQDRVMGRLTRECYLASAGLAREKGAFPLFDSEHYLAGKFVATLDPDVREEVRRGGIRNSHLTSIAPTGTISMTADNVSSSIEPTYRWRQKRRVKMMGGELLADVYDYAFARWGVRGRRAAFGEVTADEHVSVLLTAQRHVDSAVSKTINMDSSMPWEDFKAVYLRAYEGGAKGCTTFNAHGKRAGIFVPEPEPSDLPLPQEGGGQDVACYYDPESGRRTCE